MKTRPAGIRKVALTCDLLRFAPSGGRFLNRQLRNVAWLHEMLMVPADWTARAIDLTLLTTPSDPLEFEREFANSSALTEYREDAAGAWAQRYDAANLDVFPKLLESLLDQDLVVGFEMPPSLKNALHRHRREYVSFSIHPLRFLRDLCLGASTNSQRIARLLVAHEIAPEEISRQVHRFRGLFLKHRPAACAIPQDTPVLVGQTEADSVLIRNGRFQTWSDFDEQVAELLTPFSEVVLLEHPERSNSNTIIRYLRDRHNKTVIATNANSYGVLLSNRLIPRVLTLASSMGVEASSFGLPVTFLLDDPRQKFLVPGVDINVSPALGHGVLMRPFWDALLDSAPTDSLHCNASEDFALGDHYLRSTLQSWSYRALQDGLTNLECHKHLAPSADLSDDGRDRLLGDLLSCDDATPLSPSVAAKLGRSAGLDIRVLPPPLAVDETRRIHFSDFGAELYLGHGFHPPESWGVWCGTLRSQVNIPVGADALARDACLAVSMRLHVFEGLLPRAPVLRICCDDRVVGYVFFRESGLNHQTISFQTTPASASCRIDLEMSDLDTPAATGSSTDDRWLGFGLSELVVEYSIPGGASTMDFSNEAHRFWGIVPESHVAG